MEIKFVLLAFAMTLLAGGLQAQSYSEQEVVIKIVGHEEGATPTDSMQLAGTLTVPKDAKGKVPAVILITGSGAQGRDEDVFGHKPFKVIANYLSSNGYVVLRCDDRGVGESTGDIEHATTLDFATDVEFQLRYLQKRQDLGIDPNRIYLFGHSEGATVAAIVAAHSRQTDHPVAGVIMLGGAGLDGQTTLLQQNEDIFRLRGLPDSLISRRLACMRDLFAACDTIHLGVGVDTIKTLNMAFRPLFKKHSAGLNREQKVETGLTSVECYGWAVSMSKPWTITFLNLNSAGYIAQLPCPLLAIGGEKDCQVAAKPNLAAIEAACQTGGVPCQTLLLKDINHLGQLLSAESTGAVEEYAKLGQAPSDRVLLPILNWLQQQK